MGHRSKRYSMIVEDGVVKTLNIETERGVNVSGAETIMQQLKEQGGGVARRPFLAFPLRRRERAG